jgi:uncharacterized Zn-finger protein
MSEMPATAARQKRKKEKTTKFQCDNCQECFFDKSTLNRHKKTTSIHVNIVKTLFKT